MLRTCGRCRNRRIKCDALLPSCANCAKSGNATLCSSFDDTLKEDVPRSYVKSLYDRVDELKAVLALRAARPSNDNSTTRSMNSIAESNNGDDRYHHILPSKDGQHLHLGASPTTVIASTTVNYLLSSGYKLTAPSILGGEMLRIGMQDLPKHDRSTISPNIIRSLIAHHTRCIRPAYPIFASWPVPEFDTQLKNLPAFQAFGIIIACATAAVHRSYHIPEWKAVGKVLREWADELAQSIITKHNKESLIIVTMLLIHELADPSKGILPELLTFATRICIECGWREAEQTQQVDQETQNESLEKRNIISTLVSIERPLSIMLQRPALLSRSCLSTTTSIATLFEDHQQIALSLKLMGPTCLASQQLSLLIESLDAHASDESLLLHETWILFLPCLIEHQACTLCFLDSAQRQENAVVRLRSRMLSAAIALADSAHKALNPNGIMVPPLLAIPRAFLAGCVLVVASVQQWDRTGNIAQALLKCSETIAMPFWAGGRNYYEVWREIVGVL